MEKSLDYKIKLIDCISIVGPAIYYLRTEEIADQEDKRYCPLFNGDEMCLDDILKFDFDDILKDLFTPYGASRMPITIEEKRENRFLLLWATNTILFGGSICALLFNNNLEKLINYF